MPHKDEKFWSAAGITFSVGTPKDLFDARQFLTENFYPDEPIFRSTKLMTSHGFVARYLRKVIIEHYIDKPLSKPHCIIARNKHGKIIGTRFGMIFDRKNPPKEPDYRWLASLPFGKPKVRTWPRF